VSGAVARKATITEADEVEKLIKAELRS